MERRRFLGIGAGVTLAGMAGLRGQGGPEAGGRVALGFDNFSIRNWGWKAGRLLEFAAEQKCDGVMFSDLDVYESHDAAYLGEVKAQADELGLFIHAGTGGICPTSGAFNNKWGDADEHLKLVVRVAKALGSPVARCYLGNGRDRSSEGGIRARIADTVELLKRHAGLLRDSGVRMAVENHAGDMQAHELVDLIEAAGPETVGATVDAGNAAWTLEDPVRNLEILAPYAASGGIRDTMVWETDEGAHAQWKAIGEGNVDMAAYFKKWPELCPDVPVVLEIISEYGKGMPWRKPEFWDVFPEARAEDFAAFLKLAETGSPAEPFSPGDGDRDKAIREFQMAELTRSLKACQEQFGLGRRAG